MIKQGKPPALCFRVLLVFFLTRAVTLHLIICKLINYCFLVSPDEYAMAVKCDKDEINVVLHTNGPSSYYPGSVYLNDPTCKPIYQNSTHIFVKSRLGDCGTRSNFSKDGKWILYRNVIHIDSEKHQPIGSHVTRDQQMAFEFRCSYRRKALVSAVSFNSSNVVVIDVGKMFILCSFS